MTPPPSWLHPRTFTGATIAPGSTVIIQQGTVPGLIPTMAPEPPPAASEQQNAAPMPATEAGTSTAGADQHGAAPSPPIAADTAGRAGTQQGTALPPPVTPAPPVAARMADIEAPPAGHEAAVPPAAVIAHAPAPALAAGAASLTNGAANGQGNQNGPVPPEPQAARQVPLPVALDLAALRIRALMAALSQQQAGWIQQQADPNQKQLLSLACMVLSGACAEAANQLTEWARQLEASKSTSMIPDALTALLDPATYARIQTLSDVADLWMAIAPAIQGLLDQPKAPSGPAIQAVSAFLTAGSAFKDLTAEHVDPQDKSRAALVIAALQRQDKASLTPTEQSQIELQTLLVRVRNYADMNWLFYRGLTGYGILLTWLTLLTALATTTLGGRAVSSGSASTQWLAYAVAALGGLHTLLVLLNTRYSPTALAKPFMIAQKQYTRLLADIGDPTQLLLAHAKVAQQDPDIPEMDPFFGARGAAWGAPMSISERLEGGRVVFDSLRKSCPDVHLHEDGSDGPQSKQIRWALGVGMALNTIDLVLSTIQKDVPPPKSATSART